MPQSLLLVKRKRRSYPDLDSQQDYYKLEPNTCRTTRDFSLQFKHIQAESSESRYQ
jgi:hypothetical protein